MGNICCCGEKANSDDGIKQPFKDSQSSQELKGDPDYQFEMELPHEIKNEGEEDEEPPEDPDCQFEMELPQADKSKDDDNEPPEDIDDQFGMELRDDDINDDEPP
ncbi:14434_t:CDS:2, partial [Entrophospora sp. SA101]